MQIWFFFEPGVGGDGIANLIERSSNFVPYDGTADQWKIHRIVDGKPKFYSPTPDINGCFRHYQRFDLGKNCLDVGYQTCILNQQNCVVTSHDVTLNCLTNSDCLEIFTQDQVKVLLINHNFQQTMVNAVTKNLLPHLVPTRTKFDVDLTKFDYVLDATKIQTDWSYVQSFCKQVGADLDESQYHQYQDLIAGNKTYMTNNFDIDEYVSEISNDRVDYTLIDVWQPTANKSIQCPSS